jgi:predicted transcriptional regulator
LALKASAEKTDNSRKNFLAPEFSISLPTLARPVTKKIGQPKNLGKKFYVKENRSSKLKVYIDILKLLCANPSLKITQLMHKENLSYNIAIQDLTFLINLKLVYARGSATGTTIFSISERGKRALKYFKENTETLPLDDLGPGS